MLERNHSRSRDLTSKQRTPLWHSAHHRLRRLTLIRYVFPFTLLLISGFCVLGLCSPPSVRLTGTLVVRSVRLQLDPTSAAGLTADVDLPLAASARVPTQARAQIDAVNQVIPSGPTPLNGSTVRLTSSSLRLTGLTLARGGNLRITLARFSHLLRIEAGGGASFTFATGTDGTDEIRSGASWWRSDDGSVTLRSNPTSPVPMTLKARLTDQIPVVNADSDDEPPLMIADIRITDLRFGRDQVAANAEPFVSSIASGQLTPLATGETRTLGAGAPLAMTGFKGALVDLELGRDGLHLAFAGQVSKVSLGPAGFAQDVTPSWFDVLSHTAWVQALFAALLSMNCALAALLFVEVKNGGEVKR